MNKYTLKLTRDLIKHGERGHTHSPMAVAAILAGIHFPYVSAAYIRCGHTDKYLPMPYKARVFVWLFELMPAVVRRVWPAFSFTVNG